MRRQTVEEMFPFAFTFSLQTFSSLISNQSFPFLTQAQQWPRFMVPTWWIAPNSRNFTFLCPFFSVRSITSGNSTSRESFSLSYHPFANLDKCTIKNFGAEYITDSFVKVLLPLHCSHWRSSMVSFPRQFWMRSSSRSGFELDEEQGEQQLCFLGRDSERSMKRWQLCLECLQGQVNFFRISPWKGPEILLFSILYISETNRAQFCSQFSFSLQLRSIFPFFKDIGFYFPISSINLTKNSWASC